MSRVLNDVPTRVPIAPETRERVTLAARKQWLADHVQLAGRLQLDAMRKELSAIDARIDELGRTVGEELLEPTRIYAKDVLALLEQVKAKSFSHITGGGLPGNVPRCLPDGTRARLDARRWQAPPVFRWLREAGHVPTDDMVRTFNCGIGMVLATIIGVGGQDWPAVAAAAERRRMRGRSRQCHPARRIGLDRDVLAHGGEQVGDVIPHAAAEVVAIGRLQVAHQALVIHHRDAFFQLRQGCH